MVPLFGDENHMDVQHDVRVSAVRMSPHSAINSNILFNMWLRYNYRLYPAPGQQIALARAFGCARVVYNDALAAREAAYEAGEPYPTDAQLSARLTASKATSERAWLTEVSAVVLQQALADLTTAYRNYIASRTGTRNGPKMGKPRFRSRKHSRQAIRFTTNARFKVLPNGKLRLPKIGDVPVRWSRASAVPAVQRHGDQGLRRAVLCQLRH
jgi:putative transposase